MPYGMPLSIPVTGLIGSGVAVADGAVSIRKSPGRSQPSGAGHRFSDPVAPPPSYPVPCLTEIDHVLPGLLPTNNVRIALDLRDRLESRHGRMTQRPGSVSPFLVTSAGTHLKFLGSFRTA